MTLGPLLIPCANSLLCIKVRPIAYQCLRWPFFRDKLVKIFSKNECILFAGITHTRCTRMPTPSNDDPICKQFFNTMALQGIVLPGRKDAYSIVHWNNITVRNTKCCIEQNGSAYNTNKTNTDFWMFFDFNTDETWKNNVLLQWSWKRAWLVWNLLWG